MTSLLLHFVCMYCNYQMCLFSDAVVPEPGVVPIPEDVYLGLNRHRKLVQSLNPLSVPLWLIEKEQDFLARMFDDATPTDE